MKYALLRCCTTPIFLKQYESSTDAVFRTIGVELVDIQEFNCCGYPIKNLSHEAYLVSSARNLALAEQRGLNLTTICNCCYGSTKYVDHVLKQDPAKRRQTNLVLEKENLHYDGNIEVRHILDILYNDVGLDVLKEKMVRTFKNLKIATHYGCHLLRPRKIAQFDKADSPHIFDELVGITGANSITWKEKLECCGSPVWGINDNLSSDLTRKKIKNAWESGDEYLCVACPYCKLQFSRVQRMLLPMKGLDHQLPSILYTQLLGLCLGIDADLLGIHQNELDISGIVNFLTLM
ncbi:MAG: CoB--CoM heterodisulfide reductase iron-sulfur subunit B family protein [Deltaproteobacteria bacterium]|nr:CoB--CoM heterodisulfide reductase iron-sulfur subunit B family protein [Deltaproteobacteria bacterium]MBW1979207.1 CoB--CoM heterodisulfide reductase iron-sulfur subunit B family protein [Deltaproteobacteria bacterium]MBW2046819.1 CoB--CoM heterodisulfide reductase iron-sulfur subunit B family protein [Deltaproteobacteria bacterium]MBW2300273.1 CoB--CoM heterodisulfide reductase iron-sulfur subunit B family protein [Deltaproteobacteria bacterium]